MLLLHLIALNFFKENVMKNWLEQMFGLLDKIVQLTNTGHTPVEIAKKLSLEWDSKLNVLHEKEFSTKPSYELSKDGKWHTQKTYNPKTLYGFNGFDKHIPILEWDVQSYHDRGMITASDVVEVPSTIIEWVDGTGWMCLYKGLYYSKHAQNVFRNAIPKGTSTDDTSSGYEDLGEWLNVND